MAITVADLHQGIVGLWNSSGLNAEVKKQWEEAQRDTYPALHEGMATPGNPFPYVIWEHISGDIISRDSGINDGVQRHVRDYFIEFRVIAQNTASKSAKKRASELADLIMQKYGGHPSVKPQEIVTTSCGVSIVQYLNDFPARLDDEQYSWTIQYNFRVDSPVKIREAV